MNDVLIVAGESSGESYGAELVREFRKRNPSVRFFGVGGPRMKAQDVEILHPIEDLAVMGVFEVFSQIPRIRRIFRRILAEAKRRRPRAAVLIDSPDFNLRLARKLQKAGIPVLYYVSPTVWAWRKGRLKTIRKHVDRMMLIFPFEEAIYRTAGIPASYVGHPLIERVHPSMGREEFFARHGLDPEKKLVVLLPGSRKGEIGFHASVCAETIGLIRRSVPSQFVVVKAESLDRSDLERSFPFPAEEVRILDRNRYDAMAAADVVLSACGTANLEAALRRAPLVAFYRISPLTYHAGRRFVRIRHYSIVNILAGAVVVPELIQKDFTAENLAREAFRILSSEDDRAAMKREYLKIRESFGKGNASENAARKLEEFLKSERVQDP
ncbi:MAG: lipid-A-disaccharide synthase [Candidatus Aminicenantales bacterium]